ncbi:Acriflavin resistance protein A [Oleispira antarctica RB-8]|uniref:Acriflavin resistance protein A n=1 Tax=Oleispira antarctica RB-8 TaxID=698738 RepID=R4YTY6_OLEAN|nr:Acriflavin resistance protein A [Oleispira antarctica RB-8]|tara:strand:- start:542 stop:1705 length:1164 start_codon:yes stop_codon:yes gene_type:complete
MLSSRTLNYGLSLLFPLILLGCGAQTEAPKEQSKSLHVDTLTISTSNLRLSNELPARISALKKAEVRPQVTGILQTRLFKEGDFVNTDEVLYQIDPTIYQATVNSAKAQLTKAFAAESTTQKSVNRYRELLKKKLASQELYDEAESAYLQAKAEVTIKKADLDYANIELSYTKIKAPISGIIGISLASEGSLLTVGQSSYLTTIIQSDHVYVDMQQSSLSLYKLKQAFSSQTNTQASIPVLLTLEDGTEYSEKGYLEFSEAQVNASTGSVTLRAIIPNPQQTLLPGMFVRATISAPEARDYIVLPQSTIIRSQSGEPYVFIVDEKNISEKVFLELGNEVGNGWIIEKGLKSGDKVITSNLNNIKNKQVVVIDSDIDVDQLSALNEKL